MKDIFAYVGALIAIFCTLPYIIDIVKRKTKPNIITWITWSLLIGVGTAALLASNELNAALLLAGDFVATFAVVLVGLKYGTVKLDRFDFFCMVGVIVGLILWFVFNSPFIAIIATLTIDFIGTVPTIRHSYIHPQEETYITFLLGVIATIFTILSLHQYTVLAWIYPVYLLLSNGMLFVIILLGQKKLSKSSVK